MSFPSAFQSLIPSGLQPAAKAAYHRLFRLLLRIRCWYSDRLGAPPLDAPVPPAILRYRVCESFSVGEFLRVGAGCASLIQQRVQDSGLDLAGAHRVLDFGCGCGRTIRWFLQKPGQAEFHGVDVDAGAVAWCGQHLPSGRFLATSAIPPLPYPAEYFDLVYCLSVFTHLDEAMQDLWLPELKRILRPGGLLLLTIHGESALQGLDPRGREALRHGGFVHRRSRKLRGLVPDWYQTSWHSREYIVTRVSHLFRDVRYQAISGGRQDFVVARKVSA